MDIYQGITIPITAQNIQHKYEIKQADTIVIDSDGVGEGVADIVESKKLGVQEFHGGYNSKATESNKFKNLRTQFYWLVAKKFEKSGIVPFPEVDLEKAAEIVGCSPALLLSAGGSWQLRARNGRGGHLIRIIDLWYFAVSKESGKILKNRR